MKIIAIEEHWLYPPLAQAGMSSLMAQAPYLQDWGSQVDDGVNTLIHPDRPYVASKAESSKKLMDLVEQRLVDMDKHGIDMQVLSVGGVPHQAPLPEAEALHQAANDTVAQVIEQHPTRFAAFATLPWQDPKLAIKALERAVHTLGFKGALINGRPDENFLDHPRFDKLLAKFHELQVPLYIHPGLPIEAVRKPYYTGFNPEVDARLSMFGWGWHHEAGIQVLRMILAGCFDRYPQLQVISGHWGEMLPFYLHRLDDSIPQQASGLQRSILQTYREQVYVTPSGMLTLPHFEFIHAVLGADRILYSNDYPYQTLTGSRHFFDTLPISDIDKHKIAHVGIENLLKL